jgi:hypothetical protein
MKCPKCGAAARGKFCPECGTALETAACRACQAKLEPGARFCTQCGVRVHGAGPNNTPWYIAGAAILALIIVVLLFPFRTRPLPSIIGSEPPNPDVVRSATPPPLSANMRENADRLFNRVMESRETGDSAGVKQFAPMGVMAYENAGVLDNDGLYHLSLLQTAAGDPAASLATAKRILAASPNHLLALSAAADASALAADTPGARGYYEHFLRVFPTEKDKQLPEYLDHSRVFPRLEAEAKQFLKR